MDYSQQAEVSNGEMETKDNITISSSQEIGFIFRGISTK